jgi:L-fuconolactonase
LKKKRAAIFITICAVGGGREAIMSDFPIIDSHFHIWDTNILRYPWLDNRGILNKPYLLDDYSKATAGLNIEGMVFVEVSSTDYLKEVEWVSGEAKRNGKLKGIVAWIPLEKGDNVKADLENLCSNPLVKGVRRMIKKEPDIDFCVRQPFIAGMRILPQYDLVYDMAIMTKHMDNAYSMIKQCPDVKFVIEHCGEPDIKNNEFDFWSEKMGKISELPNVSCKLSGFVTKADHHNWQAEELKPYIEFIITKFGFERVMFGSDWPPITQAADIKKWVDVIETALAGEAKENLEKLFYSNAKSFFGLQ